MRKINVLNGIWPMPIDSNEDRGTREHFANLDQMAIWSKNVTSFRDLWDS